MSRSAGVTLLERTSMRLRFETQGERAVAAVLIAKWIDEILAETERGIKALGVVIDKVEMVRGKDGIEEPVFSMQSPNGAWAMELYTGTIIVDLLTVDSVAKTHELDVRVLDTEFAAGKLKAIVRRRMEFLKAAIASRTTEEFKKAVEGLSTPNGRILMVEDVEGGF